MAALLNHQCVIVWGRALLSNFPIIQCIVSIQFAALAIDSSHRATVYKYKEKSRNIHTFIAVRKYLIGGIIILHNEMYSPIRQVASLLPQLSGCQPTATVGSQSCGSAPHLSAPTLLQIKWVLSWPGITDTDRGVRGVESVLSSAIRVISLTRARALKLQKLETISLPRNNGLSLWHRRSGRKLYKEI